MLCQLWFQPSGGLAVFILRSQSDALQFRLSCSRKATGRRPEALPLNIQHQGTKCWSKTFRDFPALPRDALNPARWVTPIEITRRINESNHRITKNNKSLFKATKCWVICYTAADNNQCSYTDLKQHSTVKIHSYETGLKCMILASQVLARKHYLKLLENPDCFKSLVENNSFSISKIILYYLLICRSILNSILGLSQA